MHCPLSGDIFLLCLLASAFWKRAIGQQVPGENDLPASILSSRILRQQNDFWETADLEIKPREQEHHILTQK
jgi:hypothetical protein